MGSPGRSLAAGAGEMLQASPGIKLSLSVYFFLFLTCIGGRAPRIADGDVELPSSRIENTLAGFSHPLGNNIKRGEATSLKPTERPKVRRKRFFLDGNDLNLASLFVIDLLPTGIKPTNIILLRLTVKVED